MTLVRLYSSNFRNLEELEWAPGAGSHLLLGDNGAGKTSLLEAIYVLATTRSFRTARLAECCRHGEESLVLGGAAAGDGKTELELTSGRGGTLRKLNGSPSDLAAYLSALPVVSWTHADAEWISGSPAARRRLIDRGVVTTRPAALSTLSRYRRVLEQKRRLLMSGGPNLGPWNEVLAAAADELIVLRRSHVEALSAELGRVLAESDLELPAISLIYRPSPAEGGRGTATTLAALEAARQNEYARRAPTVGPHRDELEILWGDHPARRVASAGERKLLGLAITAARARLLAASDRRPLLLLDDLDAELDSRRLAGAWAFFQPLSEIYVTSNRATVWKPFEIDSSWFLSCGKLASTASFDSPD